MPYNAHLADGVLLKDVRPRFSVRVEHRLKALELETVGEARRIPDRKYLQAENFGRRSLNELRMELGPYVPPDEAALAGQPSWEDEPAGNGRDEAAYAPEPSVEAPPPLSPKPVPGPALSKLFVAAVENGYIIRPAYSDGYKGAADDRSWVVGSREALAAMVSWLVADRGKASPDMLGGPFHMPQPEAHYARPVGVKAAEA